MKQFKRVLAMFLCAVMVFGILPAFPFAAAAETATSSSLVWEWDFDDAPAEGETGVPGWTPSLSNKNDDGAWTNVNWVQRDEGGCLEWTTTIGAAGCSAFVYSKAFEVTANDYLMLNLDAMASKVGSELMVYLYFYDDEGTQKGSMGMNLNNADRLTTSWKTTGSGVFKDSSGYNRIALVPADATNAKVALYRGSANAGTIWVDNVSVKTCCAGDAHTFASNVASDVLYAEGNCTTAAKYYKRCDTCDFIDYLNPTYVTVGGEKHDLRYTPAKGAIPGGLSSISAANGNVAYWTCADCGEVFADKNGTTPLADTVVRPTLTSGNLLRLENYSLEDGLSGYREVSGANRIEYASVSTDKAKIGDTALKIVGDKNVHMELEHYVPVTPGQSVTIAADFWEATGAESQIYIRWYDADKEYLNKNSGAWGVFGNGDWQTLTKTVTVPDGAVYATASVYKKAAISEIYFDNLQLYYADAVDEVTEIPRVVDFRCEADVNGWEKTAGAATFSYETAEDRGGYIKATMTGTSNTIFTPYFSVDKCTRNLYYSFDFMAENEITGDPWVRIYEYDEDFNVVKNAENKNAIGAVIKGTNDSIYVLKSGVGKWFNVVSNNSFITSTTGTRVLQDATKYVRICFTGFTANTFYFDNIKVGTSNCKIVADDAYLAIGATCDAPATYYKKCACGFVDYSAAFTSGEALGHTPNIAAATCTEDQICVDCGEVLATKTNHANKETLEAIDGSCKRELGGLTEGTLCLDCFTLLDAQTATAAPEHVEEDVPAVDASCTAGGKTAGVKCSVCGTILSGCTATEATGHTASDAVIENNVDADCENAGSYDSVVYCSVCNAEISRTTVTVDATGHSYDAAVTAPDCVNGGYTTYTCSVCGDTYTGDNTAALGHTPSEAVVENNVDADCENAGSYDSVVYCSVCGEEISRTSVPVDALGHDYEAAVTAPDCENGGYTTYTCSVCGDTYIGDETAALGHDYVGVVTKEPTLNEEGVKTFTCSACGDNYTEPVAKLEGGVAEIDGFKYATIEEAFAAVKAGDIATLLVDATVTEDTILVAGATYVIPNGIAMTVNADVIAEAGAIVDCAGTIVVNGSVDISKLIYGYTFKASGGKLSIKNGGIAIMPNTWENVWTPVNDAALGSMLTACENGATAVVGTQTWALTDGAWAHVNHVGGEAVRENEVAADCENAGSYDSVVYCSVCGEEISRTTVPVDALGHSYDAVVTAPDCENGGYTTYTCTVCGDTYTGDETAALGHTASEPVVENNVAADCENAGSYDSVVYCSVCGEEISRTSVPVDALGHDYEAAVTAPDCENGGYTTYTCSVCGDTYTGDETEATGHSYDAAVTAPDCENGGYTTYTCTVCGDTYTGDETEPAGHSYDEGVVTTEPTYEAAGVMTYTCSSCGATYTEEIPQLEKPAVTGTFARKGVTLSLSGMTYLNLYVTIEGFEGIDIEKNGGILVWNSEVTEAEAVFGTEDYHGEGLIYNTNYKAYAQQTDGIIARMYADTLYIRAYVKDDAGNYYYSDIMDESVREYCEGRIAKSKDSLMVAACTELLHYGAAAQVYKNYKTDDLANKNISAGAEFNESMIDELVDSNTQIVGSPLITQLSLSLGDAIRINLYVKPDDSIGALVTKKMYFWQGVEGELTLENATSCVDMVPGNGGYGGQSEDIVAKSYGETIYACAYFVDADGNEYYSEVYNMSPEQYALGRVHNSEDAKMVAVAKALVVYGEAAKAYLNQ